VSDRGQAAGAVGREIERKFLVRPGSLPFDLATCPAETVVQGYLAQDPDGNEVRVRRKGSRCFLTVKSRGGLVRQEVELELTDGQFRSLWPLAAGRALTKTRYRVPVSGATLEVDVYTGTLEGLVIAEAEFASEEESRAFAPPSWLGRELTEDRRYRNESLATHGLPG
jgi:CYTH domain-containing protein